MVVQDKRENAHRYQNVQDKVSLSGGGKNFTMTKEKSTETVDAESRNTPANVKYKQKKPANTSSTEKQKAVNSKHGLVMDQYLLMSCRPKDIQTLPQAPGPKIDLRTGKKSHEQKAQGVFFVNNLGGPSYLLFQRQNPLRSQS